MSEELPIQQADAMKAAEEFVRQWKPDKIVDHGFTGAVAEILHRLQDHGDIIILTVDEGHALSEWLCAVGTGLEVFEEESAVDDKLKSAIKKLLFANGRCWGMTNSDMGIEDDDGEQ